MERAEQPNCHIEVSTIPSLTESNRTGNFSTILHIANIANKYQAYKIFNIHSQSCSHRTRQESLYHETPLLFQTFRSRLDLGIFLSSWFSLRFYGYFFLLIFDIPDGFCRKIFLVYENCHIRITSPKNILL